MGWRGVWTDRWITWKHNAPPPPNPQNQKHKDGTTHINSVLSDHANDNDTYTGLKLIEGHQGHDLWCHCDWPQCPARKSLFGLGHFLVPCLDLPICAVIKYEPYRKVTLPLKLLNLIKACTHLTVFPRGSLDRVREVEEQASVLALHLIPLPPLVGQLLHQLGLVTPQITHIPMDLMHLQRNMGIGEEGRLKHCHCKDWICIFYFPERHWESELLLDK